MCLWLCLSLTGTQLYIVPGDRIRYDTFAAQQINLPNLTMHLSHILQCTTQKCAQFCFESMHCGRWGRRIVRIVNLVHCNAAAALMKKSSTGNIFRVTGPLCGNSPVNSPHKGQWRGALMFSLILSIGRIKNRDAVDLRRHRDHYDVTIMHCFENE